MTKPEGPAQEPQIGEPLICKFCHLPIRNEDGGWYSVGGEHAHVSCGAKTKPWRELYDKLSPERRERIEAQVVQELAEIDHVPATPTPSPPAAAREWFMARRKMDAYISFDDMEEYAQFVARQQTAAKDAAYERLAEATVADLKALQAAKQATQRERDSYKEALKEALLYDINMDLRITIEAALKVGKDGQK